MEVDKKLHNQRLLTEYSELLIRKTKLRLYLDQLEQIEDTCSQTQKLEINTMREQLSSMEDYLFTLEKRLQMALGIITGDEE
jgi:hypothetical protein